MDLHSSKKFENFGKFLHGTRSSNFLGTPPIKWQQFQELRELNLQPLKRFLKKFKIYEFHSSEGGQFLEI
jgi:hypothetical protein